MCLADEIASLDRSEGGVHAYRDLLRIASQYGQFVPVELAYDDGKAGPPAIVMGDHTKASKVVCAHYDTVGRIAGGADNTSGVVCALLTASMINMDVPQGTSIALLPREEPPFFGRGGMGSAAFSRLIPRNAMVFAVDTIGGRKDLGDRHVMISDPDTTDSWARKDLPQAAVDTRKLRYLSDAHNFDNGVLLTDQFVLKVPMHTGHDTVANVDWNFVKRVSETLAAWIGNHYEDRTHNNGVSRPTHTEHHRQGCNVP